MAKPNYIADRDAVNNLLEEINAQRWRFGYTTQASFGEALEVSQVTAGKYLKEPGGMTLTVLRKMVRALKPNPGIVLKALGYTDSDIRKFMKEAEQ